MSGTGQNNTSAPTRLTPIVVDQPIVQDGEGKPAFPTPYFAQAFQRILSYLGQPSGGTGTSKQTGLTISEQISTLNTQVEILQASANGAPSSQGGVVSRVGALEVAIRSLMRIDRPPAIRAVPIRIPSPPRPPDLTSALIMSWWGG